MAPVNREEISLYDEAKTGLSSLAKQTAQVFVGLLVMLLLTGGNPPGWVVTLSFFVGIGFVAWSENKRLTGFEEVNLSDAPKTLADSEQQTTTSEDSSAVEPVPQQDVDLTNAEALLPQDISRNKWAVLERSNILFSPDSQKRKDLIQRVVEAKTDDLLALARIIGLNPAKDFAAANLSGADLSHANLFYANLSRANLSRATLSRTNLSGANLRYANLSRTDLSGANLKYADLIGANLSSADLFRANLSSTDLSGANLSSTDLRRADLRGANVKGARFGWNRGPSEAMKRNLTKRGATVEDYSGGHSNVGTNRIKQ